MLFGSRDLTPGRPFPPQLAFGVYDPESHVAFADNESPELHWSDVPANTKSLALIMVDIDVPTKPDDVNKEGHAVPFDLPRGRFYHWCLAGIPSDSTGFRSGEWGTGVTARGKSESSRGSILVGRNDYTGWFAGDANMEGAYFGYDGPCPPWNDERIHRYRFELYALDALPDVEPGFSGDDLMSAIKGHVIAETDFTCTHKIYPGARMPE